MCNHSANSKGPWLHKSATNLALLSLMLLGAALRLRGLTSGGLWRDDSWAALSARVGIGTAWHMWVTAPGFYFMERTWILLHHGSTEWDQILPLIIGVAGIPAIFYLAKYFTLRKWAGLFSALIVTVSPICVIYSSRLKEYDADFLLSCLIIFLAERARRRPENRQLFFLMVASVGAFFISASILPVVVGAWLMLAILALASHTELARISVGGLITAFAFTLIAAVFYRHLSPALHTFWKPYYITFESPGRFITRFLDLVVGISSYMTGANYGDHIVRALVFLVLLSLLLTGVFHSTRAMLGPILILGAAVIACALGAIPLGTGRTDEVLYPPIILLVSLGLQKAVIGLFERSAAWREMHVPTLRWPLAAIAVLLVVAVSTNTYANSGYPTEDTQALAVKVYRAFRPGDHIVVDDLMRYPWALYEDKPLRLEFGTAWATGFSVVSSQQNVFLAPSENYEGGSDPMAWTKDMDSYKRLWFVETPDTPLSLSPFYASLRRAGWHPIREITATGCAALLLVRS
jgi:hypothetical protein